MFENLWVADQPGYPIVFTPRNQDDTRAVGRRPARHVPAQHRPPHRGRREHPRHGQPRIRASGTNNIVVRNNIFDDLTSATWGTGSRPFQMGDGADVVTIDHNTIVTTDTTIYALCGTPTTSSQITNNMSVHSTYGLFGSGRVGGQRLDCGVLPGSVVTARRARRRPREELPARKFLSDRRGLDGRLRRLRCR